VSEPQKPETSRFAASIVAINDNKGQITAHHSVFILESVGNFAADGEALAIAKKLYPPKWQLNIQTCSVDNIVSLETCHIAPIE
jgi:hypothetical protein